MMSSLDSFRNLETTNLRIFLVKLSLFIYSNVSTLSMVNNNIQYRGKKLVKKYVWKYASYLVMIA
jgi:hypothetical protein